MCMKYLFLEKYNSIVLAKLSNFNIYPKTQDIMVFSFDYCPSIVENSNASCKEQKKKCTKYYFYDFN